MTFIALFPMSELALCQHAKSPEEEECRESHQPNKPFGATHKCIFALSELTLELVGEWKGTRHGKLPWFVRLIQFGGTDVAWAPWILCPA